MSTTTQNDSTAPQQKRFPRDLTVNNCRQIERVEPISHGFGGTLNLDDTDKPVPADAPHYSEIPDGSLYQTCRVAYLNGEKVTVDDRERVVLTRDYRPDWIPTDEDAEPAKHAVTLTSSRWRAGTGTGDNYSPFYKYDLKMWGIDEDGDLHDDTIYSLTAKVMPQYEFLVQPDGTPLNLPYGEGSHVQAATTYLTASRQLLQRCMSLCSDALDYNIKPDNITADSRSVIKQESYLRYDEERDADVTQALIDSASLIPHEGGDTSKGEFHASAKRKDEFKFQSEDFDRIGYHATGNLSIELKTYYAPNPDDAHEDSPLKHPKIEASLGDLSDVELSWSEYDQIKEVLDALVVGHLEDAYVTDDELIADTVLKPEQRDTITVDHSEERKDWLRSYYSNLKPDLYRELTSEHTSKPYDVIRTIAKYNGAASYDTIAEETGIARRTVRYHCRKLAEIGGENPGIVDRQQGACVFVTLTEQMQGIVTDALDSSRPADNPEKQEERKEQRQEKRAKDEAETPDEAEIPELEEVNDLKQKTQTDKEHKEWASLKDLDATIRDAMHLPRSDIAVNTESDDWHTKKPPGD